MRNIAILVCLLISSLQVNAQMRDLRFDRYHEITDSLLAVLGDSIEKDLLSEGYRIPRQESRNIKLVGYSFILEAFYNPKHSYILTLSGSTESMMHKYYRQRRGFRFRKKALFDTFLINIEKNNKLPFDIIEHLTYKFITPYYDSPNDYGLYGEYKFKQDENGKFIMIEKKLEVLKDMETIKRVHQSTF